MALKEGGVDEPVITLHDPRFPWNKSKQTRIVWWQRWFAEAMLPARLSPFISNSWQRLQWMMGRSCGMRSSSIVHEWLGGLERTAKGRGVLPMAWTQRGGWTITSLSSVCSTQSSPFIHTHMTGQGRGFYSSAIVVRGVCRSSCSPSWDILAYSISVHAEHYCDNARDGSNLWEVQEPV